MLRKNDLIKVKIQDISDQGEGIGKADGFTWFVKDGVAGDLVEAKVMKMKSHYGYARLERILDPSPHRVKPPCPVARQCGGCQIQAISYQEQLRFKEKRIRDSLTRIGGFGQVPMEPIMGMEHPWRYRNKAQFPWGTGKDGKPITGFYAGRTHAIVEQEDCLLGVEENKEILAIIKGFMESHGIRPYDEASHKGLVRHTLIRKGFRTGEIMVCMVVNGEEVPHSQKLVEALLSVKGMASICLNVNKEKTNVILGKKVVDLYGKGYITDYIGDILYRISPLSFYQVNPAQTEKLYATALEYGGLTGQEVVWDLYCGIGTISLFLARQAKMVYGVEVVPEAVEDARENAAMNGIGNVEFFVGKAEEVLLDQYRNHQVKAQVVVVDPPRKGCGQACLDTIIQMKPERVVYVSCDPATLARDARYLADGGYRLARVRGCDMFGQGVGVETVVEMRLCKSLNRSNPNRKNLNYQ